MCLGANTAEFSYFYSCFSVILLNNCITDYKTCLHLQTTNACLNLPNETTWLRLWLCFKQHNDLVK